MTTASRQRERRFRWMVVGDQAIRRGFCLTIAWVFCIICWTEQPSYKFKQNRSFPSHSRNAVAFVHSSKQQNFYNERQQQQHDDDESLRRLKALGVNISALSPETRRLIPSWSAIQAQYYDTRSSSSSSSSSGTAQPIIAGLSNCAAYRDRIPLLDRVVAPAGLFHSGTNLLVQLLQANCPRMSHTTNQSSRYGTIRGQVHGLAWQVSWGKHNPAWARDQGYHIDHDIYRNIPIEVQLPVVLIRHPYDWLQRMCIHSYSVYFPKTTRPHQRQPSQCPWLIYDEGDDEHEQYGWVPVLAKWGVGDRVYQSLAHLWNEWYREYFYQPPTNTFTTALITTTASTASYPRLVVRLEDLIFMPELVISKICHCVGGAYLPELPHGPSFVSIQSNAKSKDAGHDTTAAAINANHSMMGLVEAWIEYGHIRTYNNLTHRNLIETVFDRNLLQTFHYML